MIPCQKQPHVLSGSVVYAGESSILLETSALIVGHQNLKVYHLLYFMETGIASTVESTTLQNGFNASVVGNPRR